MLSAVTDVNTAAAESCTSEFSVDVSVGCEDDGDRGGNVRCLLASLSFVFHRNELQPEAEEVQVDPAGVSVGAVALYELLHVQPHHLLPQQQVRLTHKHQPAHMIKLPPFWINGDELSFIHSFINLKVLRV